MPVTPDSDNKAAELQRAFAMFNQVSAEFERRHMRRCRGVLPR